MLTLRRGGRGRIAAGGVLAGAVLAVMGVAAPAGAQQTSPANHIVVGSGSSTTYDMMQGLDTLFNDSLGCYMTQPSGTLQTLNFSCASNNQGQQVGEGYTENPVNDIATEEPALGSSAGIDQIEAQGPGTDNGAISKSAPINFARSSRAFATTDYPGLNFVSYATDGVSYFTFPTVAGKASPSSAVKSLTIPQLTDIWNGTDTNWDQLGGSNGSICVYVAESSSGTDSTWASALGFASAADLNAAYVDKNPNLPGCKVPAGQTYATSHTIFENEGESIVKNGDESNAIFLFSYGKYQVVCKKLTAACNDGKASTTPYLGEIDGITASPTTILCTSPCTVPFPVRRDLYNVYSNGSFATTTVTGEKPYVFPRATAATINYVSEIGFLCKAQTDVKNAEVLDPSTGVWYHTEIDNSIKSAGFIPFPLQKAEDVNTVDTPATAVLKGDGDTTYSKDDPITGSTTANNEKLGDPSGYCQVFTTDGNTAPGA